MPDVFIPCQTVPLSWRLALLGHERLKPECVLTVGIHMTQVMSDPESGKSRGFGFVSFADEQGMNDAIQNMNDSELDGRRISVRKAEPKGSFAGKGKDGGKGVDRGGSGYGDYGKGGSYGAGMSDGGYGGRGNDFGGRAPPGDGGSQSHPLYLMAVEQHAFVSSGYCRYCERLFCNPSASLLCDRFWILHQLLLPHSVHET